MHFLYTSSVRKKHMENKYFSKEKRMEKEYRWERAGRNASGRHECLWDHNF